MKEILIFPFTELYLSVTYKRTDFISNFVMINSEPAWLNFDEGRVIMNGSSVYFTETHLKDHTSTTLSTGLDNTRVVFGRSNNALVVRQVNSYYPFGMNIEGLTTFNLKVDSRYSPNEYLYNGNPDSYREFQDELGLDWLDYGARFYDPALVRFHTVDPLAEQFSHQSPFVYADNNPILFIDFLGMNATVYLNGEDDATKAAFAQLQSSTNMTLNRNSGSGKISASGDPQNENDRLLLNAINDVSIKVDVTATNSNRTSNNNEFLGGAFMGNSVTSITESIEVNSKPFISKDVEIDRFVNAKQEVNPGILSKMDAYDNTPGVGILHEVTEAYIGGQISRSTGIPAGPAIVGPTENPIFNQAHQRATKQPARNNLFSREISNGIIYYLGTPTRMDVILKSNKK